MLDHVFRGSLGRRGIWDTGVRPAEAETAVVPYRVSETVDLDRISFQLVLLLLGSRSSPNL